ncbi:MAG: hypothetical protein ACREYE_29980 [Gammaproteobacteria bacterium]
MSTNGGLCSAQRGELILLVHQDSKSQESIRHVLARAGYRRVVAVDTARAVVSKLQHGSYNLLITSYLLPDGDAWTLARIVRSGRFCRKSLPIVVLFEGNASQTLRAMVHEH